MEKDNSVSEPKSNSAQKRRKRKPKNKQKPPAPESNNVQTITSPSASNTTQSALKLIEKETPKEMKKHTAADSNQASKEQVLAEREARRLAKLAAKHKQHDEIRELSPQKPLTEQSSSNPVIDKPTKLVEEKSRDDVMAERELKKLAKQMKKKGVTSAESSSAQQSNPTNAPVLELQRKKSQPDSSLLVQSVENLKISSHEDIVSKPAAMTKAERRAIQEAQRAAKAKLLEEKKVGSTKVVDKSKNVQPTNVTVKKTTVNTNPLSTTQHHRVKLFSHLYADSGDTTKSILLNSNDIHPAIVKLGSQYASRMIVGSNARCLAFMAAMKCVIQDYRTPPQKEFARGLEENIQPGITYLHQCRPLAVSVINAIKFIKWQITQLPSSSSDGCNRITDHQLREKLLDSIDTHIRDQIEKAAQAISISVQEKISNGDVILTFGCSSLINHILEEAQSRRVNFRVIVVDARPDNEGRQQLVRLVAAGIKCSFILINAIGFIMPDVTKVLLGAHALLANGYVTARSGTAQVALIAKTYNVPVLVCCETHKFSERVQTDAFVYNELGDPSDILRNTKQTKPLANWKALSHLTPLNLKYDITPPELVTAVVTELAIMPCTSVPVILRIKPSEIGY